MTYPPALELKLGNGTSYEDWEAGVRRVFFDVSGIQSGREGIDLDDLDLDELDAWYDADTSARETAWRLLDRYGLMVDPKESFEDEYEYPLTGRERALGVG